jgi:hypothetical protein
MTLFSKKIFILLALFIMAPITENAATVDLDAVINTNPNPVELKLKGGTYKVTPIAGRTFAAWNYWGRTNGCSCGADCRRASLNNYSITTPTESIFMSDGDRYSTPTLALLNALSTTFTLTKTTIVNFFIPDQPYRDNLGGMSLNVSEVPVTAAAFLFSPALLGFLGLRRKTKNTVA